MTKFPSIIFTDTHHDDIADLYDNSSISDEERQKGIENLRKNIVEDKPVRFLYVIKQYDTEFYKIGITNDVNTRISQLQVGSPQKLKYILSAEADMEDFMGKEIRYLEQLLHKNYSSLKIRGEWFKLTKEHIAHIHFFLEDMELDVFHNDAHELSIYKMQRHQFALEEGD